MKGHNLDWKKNEKSTPPKQKRSRRNRTCNCWTCTSMYCNFILL